MIDAVTYLKERERLCASTTCLDCPFSDSKSVAPEEETMFCEFLEFFAPSEAVDILEKWSRSHPIKTYIQKLIEKFPSTLVKDGVPDFCRISIYGGKCSHSSCVECWNEPIDENEEERQVEREM